LVTITSSALALTDQRDADVARDALAQP